MRLVKLTKIPVELSPEEDRWGECLLDSSL